jgi:DNA-dependent RNA polymerase auxiliary subunit epsilon
MADLSISQLPSASIATGSNVLPIVQGGVTDQITVTDLGKGIFNLNLPLTASGIVLNGNKQFNYGNFYSTQSQTNPVGNVSHSMYVETDAGSNGVTVANQTRITVQNTGTYNLQFSTQFEKTSNGVDTTYVWFKKNGINIVDSATSLDIAKQAGGGGRAVAAWNIVLPLSSSEYVEIVWQAADTTIQIAYDPASGNIPAIPSVIATLTQVS